MVKSIFQSHMKAVTIFLNYIFKFYLKKLPIYDLKKLISLKINFTICPPPNHATLKHFVSDVKTFVSNMMRYSGGLKWLFCICTRACTCVCTPRLLYDNIYNIFVYLKEAYRCVNRCCVNHCIMQSYI